MCPNLLPSKLQALRKVPLTRTLSIFSQTVTFLCHHYFVGLRAVCAPPFPTAKSTFKCNPRFTREARLLNLLSLPVLSFPSQCLSLLLLLIHSSTTPFCHPSCTVTSSPPKILSTILDGQIQGMHFGPDLPSLPEPLELTAPFLDLCKHCDSITLGLPSVQDSRH